MMALPTTPGVWLSVRTTAVLVAVEPTRTEQVTGEWSRTLDVSVTGQPHANRPRRRTHAVSVPAQRGRSMPAGHRGGAEAR